MKQKAAVTFEKEETLVIRQSAYFTTDFCPICDDVVDMLAPEVLARMAESTEREIFRWIENGFLPFVETKRIYACLPCYRRLIEQNLAKVSGNAEGAAAKILGDRGDK